MCLVHLLSLFSDPSISLFSFLSQHALLLLLALPILTVHSVSSFQLGMPEDRFADAVRPALGILE